MTTTVIYDFDINDSLRNWYIVNDGVMGGVSESKLTVDSEGNGVFSGRVRLENNGGFASVRYDAGKINADPNQKLKIRLKGDGKTYQIRIRPSSNTYYSYVSSCKTTGEWEEIEIQLASMYPVFRGRRLNLPNYNHDQIGEFAILIGNKKDEEFELLIDYIKVETDR